MVGDGGPDLRVGIDLRLAALYLFLPVDRVAGGLAGKQRCAARHRVADGVGSVAAGKRRRDCLCRSAAPLGNIEQPLAFQRGDADCHHVDRGVVQR